METDPRGRWDNISVSAVKELIRQAEKQVADLLAVSLAADQRAMNACRIFVAGAAALFAIFATGFERISTASAVALLVMAVMLYLAALLCLLAGRPRTFFISGYEPEKLIGSAQDEEWMLRYICDDLQDRIAENRKIIERSARLLTAAYIVAGASVPVSFAVWILLTVIPLS